MTNRRACASNEAQPVEPVGMWENESAKGLALCTEQLFRKHIEYTQSLRDRQTSYLGSLPSYPPEVIRAALKLMHPSGDEYPDGIEEALQLSHALEVLVKEGDLDKGNWNRDAALYVVDRVGMAMNCSTRQIDHISAFWATPDGSSAKNHLSK